MATKVIIPTSYGSPSATFWINDQKYVLPTGVEVTAPDEVALLISQHEAREKGEEPPRYLPDVVDVVFAFAGFSGTNSFPGVSNKSLEEILRELGGRGVEHLNLLVKNTGGIISVPYRVEITSYQIVAYWIGSGETSGSEYGIRIYSAILTNTSGMNITAEPKANILGGVIM